MEFSRGKIKQIRQLMFLAALLVLGIIYFKEIMSIFSTPFGIIKPFIYGASSHSY
jgi:hypothetical protein